MPMQSYECENPPCIHVVVDDAQRIFAVFVEDWEGNILLIRADEVVKAAERIKHLIDNEYREASPNQADYLARHYLNAEPIEE